MSRIRNVRSAVSGFGAVLLAVAIAPSAAYPQEAGGSPPPSRGRSPAETIAHIESQLGHVTVVEVVEMPLEELLLADLADRHDILILLDEVAMEEAGAPTDVPVTWTLRGITLESALNVILGQLHLTWMIRDEALVITTLAVEETQTEARLYNVADLIADSESIEAFLEVVRIGLDRGQLRTASGRAAPWRGPGGGGRASRGGGGAMAGGGAGAAMPGAGGGAMPGVAGGGGMPGVAGDGSVPDGAAGSRDAGPSVAVYRDMLIVRDTQRRHRDLQQLLDEIRAARSADGAPAAR